VIRRSSSEAWVDTPRGILYCSLRGKLRDSGPCVAGDRVLVAPLGPETGAIERLLPRRSELRRGAITGEPEGRTAAANIDQVVIVVSASPPPPRWALADRILVEAGCQDLVASVAVNKLDLVPVGEGERAAIEETAAVYRAAGFPVHLLSAATGEGFEAFFAHLIGKSSTLAGHSGVGKTTILNRLVPGAGLPTGDVNPVTGKGRHKTTWSVLVKLPGGGYVADTPGFREFGLVGIQPEDLGKHYPEFLDVISGCRFKDCLHREEPRCALKAAVEEGRVSRLRYQNYLQILRTLVDTEATESARRSARRRAPESS
jgi:ribosome biogenesis GTPase